MFWGQKHVQNLYLNITLTKEYTLPWFSETVWKGIYQNVYVSEQYSKGRHNQF